MDVFFKLGDKVTKGDPQKKADYDYYMMWIIFLAFIGVFGGNLWEFIQLQKFASLGWAAFALAILWFQYHNLINMREMRKIIKGQVKQEFKIESEDEMMKEFKDKKKIKKQRKVKNENKRNKN